MTSIEKFDKWAEGLELNYFLPHELRFMGGSYYDPRSKAYGLNSLPPKELWENIAQIAIAADTARGQFGAPIRILSGYRSPAYNKAIRGAKHSRHLQFDALDLAPMNGKISHLHAILKRLRKEGAFCGGIGRYSTFIHIDNRGHIADW